MSMAALEVGVDLMLEAPIAELRSKSVHLVDLFLALVAQECAAFGFAPLTPADASRRGSQISFAHPGGYAIMQALIERGVIGDFRAPDVLRFGLAPLYVRYTDIWDAVATLSEVMEVGEWRDTRFAVSCRVT